MNEENKDTKDQVRPTTYDGIQEYDNQLPRWWLFTFVITILFAFMYWSRYFVFESAPNQKNELEKEMAEVQNKIDKKTAAISSDQLLAILKDPTVAEKGSAIFKTYCFTCHGQHGEGGIGPNLTDHYWLHGGEPENILNIISNGVAEKGMTPWKGVLSISQIQQAAAYVIALQGTHPANPKAPQGELLGKKM